MPATPFAQLMLALTAWSLLSLGSAVVGLYARPREFWRGFWFMSGMWGLLDGAIAAAGQVGEPPPLAELAGILKLNAGLDVAYLAVGAGLFTRPKPVLKGFGVAILAQGLFLLALDLAFWRRVEAALNP